MVSFCFSPFADPIASFVEDETDSNAEDGVDAEVSAATAAGFAVVSERLATVESSDWLVPSKSEAADVFVSPFFHEDDDFWRCDVW